MSAARRSLGGPGGAASQGEGRHAERPGGVRQRGPPEEGEPCVVRAKSGETLMEARSHTDVQIVCHDCVHGAKD